MYGLNFKEPIINYNLYVNHNYTGAIMVVIVW